MSEFQENLWAPWRMEYIRTLADDAPACFLCHYRDHAEADAKNHVLWRGPRTIVALNRFPYSNGHLMVAPLRHGASLEDLADDELLELLHRVRDAKLVLAHAVNAQGFNVGFNLGHCAGAGLPDHLHCHVVPRWAGDVNYMAVLADVKVVPEALTRTAERLRASAAKLGLPRD